MVFEGGKWDIVRRKLINQYWKIAWDTTDRAALGLITTAQWEELSLQEL